MINIHRLMIVENEHLYGPGKRLLVYLKGCSIHCEGCVNSHLWSFDGGIKISAEEIISICKKENVEGITLHGGEPLDQAGELEKVINLAKAFRYTIVLFTGYLYRELNSIQKRVWNKSDLVIAGRFDLNKRNVNLQFRGSSNQKVYTHHGPYKKYKLHDGLSTTIIAVNKNGTMDINGFLTEDILDLI